MGNVIVTKNLKASRSAVWEVLADYPNIAAWNSGIKHSEATSDATSGVGAQRHCDLSPVGGLEETIREWEPETRMVISIDEVTTLPIKTGLAAFDLVDGGDSTSVTITYDFEMKGGPIGAAMGPVMKGQLEKGFGGFLDDLEIAAQAV
ncbi:MAG: SRPBCC family protein [Acidimicrobiales bacterium]|nr:SRPBCC family protein [Acidimicrobiales bacterium]RZV43746.1 MAG: SRPBCC family protein [Acidimicrobiales bacterium]